METEQTVEEKNTLNNDNNETKPTEGNVSEEEEQTSSSQKVEKKNTSKNNIYEDKAETTGRDVSEGNKRQTHWSLCLHCCLPPWLQDNSYIVSGHRPPLNSFSECFWSIFRIHSETVNIWTHLLGFFIFSVLAILYYFLQTAPLYEKLTLFPFFLGSILCLGFSFAFHTFYCHSPSMVRVFSILDYCGISLLILGSIISWVSYTFYCYFWWKILYLSFTTAFGLTVILISLQESFSSPEYRPVRAGIFTLFGLCGVVPFAHFWWLEGLNKLMEIGKPVFFTAFLYISGAVLYALRVPERMFPGRFDILFQSHQIFHVLVLLATMVNYLGLSRISSQPKTC